MKKIFLLSVFCLSAGFVAAQNSVEVVSRPPVYGDEDFITPGETSEYIESSSDSSSNGSLNSSVIAEDNEEVAITTEAGTSTYTVATSTKEEEEPLESLSDVVSRINDQYDEQKAQCETGSWFARIWCKITSWF